MKICTFNVNGVRSRLHQLHKLVEKHNPDIIGLQEIKCVDDAFPRKDVSDMGYHIESFGQKGYHGVALLSKKAPVSIIKGFPGDESDAQRRMIIGTYEDENGNQFKVFNGYFPQGENRNHETKFPAKAKFYNDLLNYLKENCNTNEKILIMGDMNIAPLDIDIGIGEQNAKKWLKAGKCSFLPEEREWIQNLKSWGTFDIFREIYPDKTGIYSWFDYRSDGFSNNRGLRIDVMLATKPLLKMCKSIEIDHEIRAMEKPSDHCPIIAVFN